MIERVIPLMSRSGRGTGWNTAEMLEYLNDVLASCEGEKPFPRRLKPDDYICKEPVRTYTQNYPVLSRCYGTFALGNGKPHSPHFSGVLDVLESMVNSENPRIGDELRNKELICWSPAEYFQNVCLSVLKRRKGEASGFAFESNTIIVFSWESAWLARIINMPEVSDAELKQLAQKEALQNYKDLIFNGLVYFEMNPNSPCQLKLIARDFTPKLVERTQQQTVYEEVRGW